METTIAAFLRRHFAIHHCRVMARPLGAATPAARQAPGLRYRLLAAAEIQACVADPALDLPQSFVEAAAARNDACVGAFDGACIVGYAWLAFAAAPYKDRVWVRFDPRACLVYRVHVRPEYAGRGVEDRLRVVADDLCIWAGKSYAISFVQGDNAGSIAAAERAGAQTVAHAAYLPGLGIHWAVRTLGAEPLEFSFYEPGPGIQSSPDGGAHRMEQPG